MKSRLAKTAGFCMGVRRAVEIVLDTANKNKGEIFTRGPLIHNPQVLELLEGKQVRALEEGERPQGGTVVIRAHGVPPEVRQEIRSWGVELKDATCPKVARVQGIIKKHAHQGYYTVIVGDKGHPEVAGLLGYAEGRGHVIGSPEEIESLPPAEKVCVVAQTTQNTVLFDSIEKALRDRFPEAKIFNTICDSTQKRQEEVQALSRSVDAMVVVGGRMSGNTKRLAELSASQGTPTYLVETEEELGPELLKGYRTIGITAGASTPHWMIRRVVERIESMAGEEGRGLRRTLRVFLSLLLRTNGALTLGALGLTLAATKLQGLPLRLSILLVPVLYLFAMHSLHRWQNIASDRFNQPARAHFYERWGWLMLSLAAGAVLLALVLAGRASLGAL
ncbi:MAG: 4-hydroxy-3-methylbut-2-enyl diphosphate reductase, partial [Nitrospinota bacterium]